MTARPDESKHLRPRFPSLVILALLAGFAGAAQAQDTGSLNLWGTTGLIDMPSAESQPDGLFSVSSGHFGPFSRNTLTFQVSPRLSASFRYQAARGWGTFVPSPLLTNYYRNFDVSFRVLDESRYLPSVSIGMRDFIGTGGEASEYIVATKNLGPRLKVTAGLGWGRLAGHGAIGQPFGQRRSPSVGVGGTAHFGSWFTGDVAPFGGIEYRLTDRLTLKAEYSSDAYPEETGARRMMERRTPYNFGIEYQKGKNARFGLYSMYGSSVGFAAHFLLDPSRARAAGSLDPAPQPIGPRPAALGWGDGWDGDGGTKVQTLKGLRKQLASDGISVSGLRVNGSTVEIQVASGKLDNRAQVIGRTARALAAQMPGDVENFAIIPVSNGMPLSRILIRRGDLERLEHVPANDEAMYAAAEISAISGAEAGPWDRSVNDFPRFTWNLGPYARVSLFDPNNPVAADGGIRLKARYDIAPGLFLSGQISKRIGGNLSSVVRPSDSVLPHVRSESSMYNKFGDPSLDHLTLAWYAKPDENLYSRVTAGYLESMYGGVSGELLWKRVDKPYALGVELNYARQRDFNQQLGFQNYSIVTGHVSGYLALGKGYHAQVDVGRYLAGDVGATLSLDREFENGWRVGAFATLTNVPFSDFGEGSFDKGIRFEIPLSWALGSSGQKKMTSLIRPILRDGGARLDVQRRLYDQVRGYHERSLKGQWGRFWR
jgi:hypothetical protein